MNAPISIEIVPDSHPQRTSLNLENTAHIAAT